MFKELKNECIITFDLITNGPLLIRSGDSSQLDPTVPDIQFIKGVQDGKLKPVIPGSSIKGVFRSKIERILYSIYECCDIFDKENNCRIKYKGRNGAERYNESCPACKMFGNFGLKGRVQFKDAFAKDGYKLGRRTNVGIDRITGASIKGALFQPEVLEEGCFPCEIKLENYFRWQIKLLIYVMSEINEGYVTFGSSTSRGFGNMKCEKLKVISKEFGDFEDGFYKINEYELDELTEVLKNTKIEKKEIKEVNLDGQAI